MPFSKKNFTQKVKRKSNTKIQKQINYSNQMKLLETLEMELWLRKGSYSQIKRRKFITKQRYMVSNAH